MREEKDGQNGIQSLETGMGVLRVLVQGQRAMMLKDIAQRAGMPPAKAHRYLVSLIRSGLVTQDPASARYDLGPFALHMGLAAVNRLDRIRLGLDAIAALRSAIHETTALAIWSDAGPVIVRWERPHRAITVNVATGVHLPLLRTAGGLVFAAWLPADKTRDLLLAELQRQPAGSPLRNMDDVQQRLGTIRSRGLASIRDNYMAQGIEAIGAPVFNFRNEVTMAIVVVGIVGVSQLGADSAARSALLQAAQHLSQRLGAPAPVPEIPALPPGTLPGQDAAASANGMGAA